MVPSGSRIAPPALPPRLLGAGLRDALLMSLALLKIVLEADAFHIGQYQPLVDGNERTGLPAATCSSI